MNLSTYTHPNGTVIPLEKVCPQCGGKPVKMGTVDLSRGGMSCEITECKSCKVTGKVPIYYTPEEVEKLTGEKMPDWFPVYFWLKGGLSMPDAWVLITYRGFLTNVCVLEGKATVVTAFGPEPPADYRPVKD